MPNYHFKVKDEGNIKSLANDLGVSRDYLVDPKNWEYCGPLEHESGALQPTFWLDLKGDINFMEDIPFDFGKEVDFPMENEVEVADPEEFKKFLDSLGMTENPDMDIMDL